MMYTADNTVMNMQSSIVSETPKQDIEFEYCHDKYQTGPDLVLAITLYKATELKHYHDCPKALSFAVISSPSWC